MIWSDKPCLLWLGAKNSAGYGTIGGGRKKRYVHRVTWERTHGPIPDGLWVLHRCDVRNCYEISHLWLGTHADNMRDMAEKHRSHSHGGLHGASNPAAKLTPDQVHAIRQAFDGTRGAVPRLAQSYGMSITAIRAIVTGTGWKRDYR